MVRTRLSVTGIEEGKEIQIKGSENIFNKITEEKIPNVKKEVPRKVQEAYRTPNRLDQRRNFL